MAATPARAAGQAASLGMPAAIIAPANGYGPIICEVWSMLVQNASGDGMGLDARAEMRPGSGQQAPQALNIVVHTSIERVVMSAYAAKAEVAVSAAVLARASRERCWDLKSIMTSMPR